MIAAYGGMILFVSALCFVTVVFATWVGGRRIEAPPFEFAVPLMPVTTPGIWDRYGLWTVIAIVLVLAAYGYPLFQLLSHPRFGSPPFKPF
jgi:cytochrome c oxidase subunit 1